MSEAGPPSSLPSPRPLPGVLRAARLVAGLVIGVAVLVWVGWLRDWGTVTKLVSAGPTMKPNTATGFLLLGAALWQATVPRRRWTLALVTIVALLNGLTVLEYMTDLDLGVDGLLMRAAVTDAAPPGRTALSSALGFLAVAGALASVVARRPRLADFLALAGGAVGLLGVIMHTYGDTMLVARAAFTIAIHTAVCLLLLAIGALLANGDGGVMRLMSSSSAGGALARRLLPLTIFLPIALAWVRLVSLRAHLIDDESGLAFLAISLIVIFTGMVWWSASTLDVADSERAKARAASEVARGVAEEANRAKDEFLTMLGHELRNPLAPIFTAVDRMKGGRLSGFARELEIVERQSRHLERLVGDLMDVSRIFRRSLAMHRAPLGLKGVLDAAVERVDPLLRDAGQELRVDAPDVDAWVEGDADRLVQVVVSLLVNSIKYSPRGALITLTLSRRTDVALIEVKDEGAGIAPALLDRVAEPFVQEPQAIDRVRGGLGLGLAIVRAVTELHGGSVAIASAGEGRGTCVTIELPEVPPPTSARAPAPAPVAELGRISAPEDTRVLVVDDNADAVEMMLLMLEEAGYTASGAYDGEAALRAVDDLAPHVVLLDIGLPKLDGYEVARRLRARRGGRGMLLIAYTGFGQPDDRKRAFDAGFDHHLVKPIAFAELAALLASPRASV